MKQNKKNMNFLLTFKFLQLPNSQDMFSFEVIYASIKNHQHSFGKLNQFQFEENGRCPNQQTKKYLTQLVSYSKKMCSTPRKHPGAYLRACTNFSVKSTIIY